MRFIASILIVFGMFSAAAFSQSAEKKVKELVNEKELDAAAHYIPAAMSENPKDFDFLMLCGDIYFELEKLDSALLAYEKAYSIDDMPTIMRKIGRVKSMLGKHSEAIKYLKNTIDEDKKDLYSHLELAQAYLRADSLTQAELSITRARELDSKNPASFIAMGDYYFKQGVYELAKDNYEEALSIDENLLEAREKLAISYYWLANRESDSDLRNGLFNRSLEEWNTITKKDPKNARAFYEQGRILYFSREYGTAAQSLYQYVKLRPAADLARWYLAQSLVEVGSCDSSEQHLIIVSQKIDSVKIKAKLMLARCYLDKKDFSQALKVYNDIRKDTVLDVTNLQYMGNAALLTQDTATAILVWKEAIEQNPAVTCRLMYILGTQLNKMKDYDGAIYILKKRLATGECQDSLNSIVHYFIGISYLFLEKPNPDSAKIELEKSIALDSTFLFSQIYYGDALAALNDLAGAERMFLNVIEKGPVNLEKNKSAMNQAYAKLCSIKLDQKKYADLIKIAKMWSDSNPDLPYPPLYMAVGYQGSGDTENACKQYKKVLQLDPKNATARKNKDALKCE